MHKALSSWVVCPASVIFVLAVVALAFAESSEVTGVHNFFRATTSVFSGSQPEGDVAFAALAKLGVKTIISVDGAKPDVECAARHGMRYIHLPIGYDGISTNRMAELAKAAAISSGPVYLHCHHGKHRGPAAVSVVCMADAGWTAQQAEEFMRKAGTGAEYQGLYRAVRDFKVPTSAQLAAMPTNFPSVAKTSSLVGAMVAVDNIYENLKLVQSAGWRTPANHSDITPSHEALMLLEQFRELERNPDTARRPDDYRARLGDSIAAIEALQRQLAKPAADHLDEAFKSVGQSCTGCHRQFRNG